MSLKKKKKRAFKGLRKVYFANNEDKIVFVIFLNLDMNLNHQSNFLKI